MIVADRRSQVRLGEQTAPKVLNPSEEQARDWLTRRRGSSPSHFQRLVIVLPLVRLRLKVINIGDAGSRQDEMTRQEGEREEMEVAEDCLPTGQGSVWMDKTSHLNCQKAPIEPKAKHALAHAPAAQGAVAGAPCCYLLFAEDAGMRVFLGFWPQPADDTYLPFCLHDPTPHLFTFFFDALCLGFIGSTPGWDGSLGVGSRTRMRLSSSP
ncbi:uncharacterized protein E0L32_001017 [Thyridium curvatum]|uniref:Uncharacterized protein n=1 Tax=Thyridium curvatum TaxID=1093900 RepID=A0A507B1N8_9PEZI|nr:uncharacterized protein E0L32_001017 [Thyridium curvatum]TPX11199.1 hypothetical protein E0L32_001017 [Thyridium curvatum]